MQLTDIREYEKALAAAISQKQTSLDAVISDITAMTETPYDKSGSAESIKWLINHMPKGTVTTPGMLAKAFNRLNPEANNGFGAQGLAMRITRSKKIDIAEGARVISGGTWKKVMFEVKDYELNSQFEDEVKLSDALTRSDVHFALQDGKISIDSDKVLDDRELVAIFNK